LPPLFASGPIYMIALRHTFVCDVKHPVVAIDAAYWGTAPRGSFRFCLGSRSEGDADEALPCVDSLQNMKQASLTLPSRRSSSASCRCSSSSECPSGSQRVIANRSRVD